MPNDLRNLAIAAVSEAGGKSPRMAALLYKLAACACDDDPVDDDAIPSFNVQGPPISFSENTGTLTLIPGITTVITVPAGGQRVQIIASLTMENATITPAGAFRYQIFVDLAAVNTTAYATFAAVSGQFIASGATAVNLHLPAGAHTIELRAATTTPGAPVTMVGGDGRLNIIQIPS